MGRRSPSRSAHGGVTIVELMVTLSIVAVVLAIAVPSFQEFIARQRVEGVAGELATDLRLLRSSRSQRAEPVQIDFGRTNEFTCYILYSSGRGFGGCDCTRTQQPVCDAVAGGSVELKTVVVPRSSGVEVSSVPATMTLDQLNGLPQGGVTLRVSVKGIHQGGEVRVFTNAVATPAVCSVSGHGTSLPACP